MSLLEMVLAPSDNLDQICMRTSILQCDKRARQEERSSVWQLWHLPPEMWYWSKLGQGWQRKERMVLRDMKKIETTRFCEDLMEIKESTFGCGQLDGRQTSFQRQRTKEWKQDGQKEVALSSASVRHRRGVSEAAGWENPESAQLTGQDQQAEQERGRQLMKESESPALKK